MPPAIRLGDPASHPGAVISSAIRTRIVSVLAARQGDTFGCIEHGPNPIAGGSLTVRIEGRPAARHGDPTACTASLIATQSTVIIG